MNFTLDSNALVVSNGVADSFIKSSDPNPSDRKPSRFIRKARRWCYRSNDCPRLPKQAGPRDADGKLVLLAAFNTPISMQPPGLFEIPDDADFDYHFVCVVTQQSQHAVERARCRGDLCENTARLIRANLDQLPAWRRDRVVLIVDEQAMSAPEAQALLGDGAPFRSYIVDFGNMQDWDQYDIMASIILLHCAFGRLVRPEEYLTLGSGNGLPTIAEEVGDLRSVSLRAAALGSSLPRPPMVNDCWNRGDCDDSDGHSGDDGDDGYGGTYHRRRPSARRRATAAATEPLVTRRYATELCANNLQRQRQAFQRQLQQQQQQQQQPPPIVGLAPGQVVVTTTRVVETADRIGSSISSSSSSSSSSGGGSSRPQSAMSVDDDSAADPQQQPPLPLPQQQPSADLQKQQQLEKLLQEQQRQLQEQQRQLQELLQQEQKRDRELQQQRQRQDRERQQRAQQQQQDRQRQAQTRRQLAGPQQQQQPPPPQSQPPQDETKPRRGIQLPAHSAYQYIN